MFAKLSTGLVIGWLALFSTLSAAGNIDGVWRGQLEVQPNMKLVFGVTVANGEATLASPNQGMTAHPLSDFQVDGDVISFKAADLGIAFSGERDGERIVGEFVQGRSMPLTLERLNQSALERMAFEGRYSGALKVRGKDLPLQVNVAVVKDGYYGTLDSPAQQTYGVPLSEVEINAQVFNFKSPMLQASFQATRQTEASPPTYTGLWIQGGPMGLTLTKRTAEHPEPEVELAKLGEQGGAYAVIAGDKVNTHYFADHSTTTQYEIGSVTKTFVAYLLAQAVLEGRVALTTPLQDIIPEAPAGITLESLATHTSGLPRLPEDLFNGAVGHDPYAHYGREQLRAALGQQTLGEPKHLYSNYAVGALGEALAMRYETSLSALLTDKILQPMAMADSYLATPNSTPAENQLAVPHDSIGNRVSAWHFQALAGAGGIVATLPDMVKYVQQLQQQVQQNEQLAQLLLTPRTELGKCCQQALGWLLETDESGNMFAWHNGQTAGFSSYVGFYLDGSRAVVVLNNQATNINAEAKRLLTQ